MELCHRYDLWRHRRRDHGLTLFKRIDHIELLTAAPERMLAFYRDVLGFPAPSRSRIPQTPAGPRALGYLDLGGTTVELMCYPQASIPPRSSERALGYLLIAL